MHTRLRPASRHRKRVLPALERRGARLCKVTECIHLALGCPEGCATPPSRGEQSLLRRKRLLTALAWAPSWHAIDRGEESSRSRARTARVSMGCRVRAQTALAAQPRSTRLRTQPRVLLLERRCQSCASCAPEAEPTTCFKIKEVLGVSMCTEKMINKESRCGRVHSDEEICYYQLFTNRLHKSPCLPSAAKILPLRGADCSAFAAHDIFHGGEARRKRLKVRTKSTKTRSSPRRFWKSRSHSSILHGAPVRQLAMHWATLGRSVVAFAAAPLFKRGVA